MARTADPNASIVRFFITKPLALAQQALSTAKTIVAERTRNETTADTPRKRTRVRKKVTPSSTVVAEGTSPGVQETAVATPVVGTTAAPKPVGRRRPSTAITAPGATVTPINPTGAMPPLGTGTTTSQS